MYRNGEVSCSPEWNSRFFKNDLGAVTFGVKEHRHTKKPRYYCKFLPEAKNKSSKLEFGSTVDFEIKGNSALNHQEFSRYLFYGFQFRF